MSLSLFEHNKYNPMTGYLVAKIATGYYEACLWQTKRFCSWISSNCLWTSLSCLSVCERERLEQAWKLQLFVKCEWIRDRNTHTILTGTGFPTSPRRLSSLPPPPWTEVQTWQMLGWDFYRNQRVRFSLKLSLRPSFEQTKLNSW